MEITDRGITLTGEEASVFGRVVMLSGNRPDKFPCASEVDGAWLRSTIKPFGFGPPHDVEIAREDFPEILLGANAVLANLDEAVDELSRDPVGDRMPINPNALRDLATTVEIRSVMRGILYWEEREQRLAKHRARFGSVAEE